VSAEGQQTTLPPTTCPASASFNASAKRSRDDESIAEARPRYDRSVGDEILEVLKEIRDEAKQTNTRLESLEGHVQLTNTRLESLEGHVQLTNTRLESLEWHVQLTNTRLESLGRVQFVDKRLSSGFEGLTGRLDAYVERLDLNNRRQTEGELRLSSEVLSLADVTRDVRDLLPRKLDDHQQVAEHEQRIRALEDRIADRLSD
jgi:chromosome segregation ATPase